MPYLFLLLFLGMALSSQAQGLHLVKQRALDGDAQATPVQYLTAENFKAFYNIIWPQSRDKHEIYWREHGRCVDFIFRHAPEDYTVHGYVKMVTLSVA